MFFLLVSYITLAFLLSLCALRSTRGDSRDSIRQKRALRGQHRACKRLRGLTMVATRSTRRRRATPLLVLWRRDDARAAVVDFLPTETIAVLAMVAKPLREAQSCLLITAIRRRGKAAVPNPPTTRALLDALLVGEPHYFCETWERGYSPQCRLVCNENAPLALRSSVQQSPDGGYFLELSGSGTGHKGYALSLRQAQNLLVKRLRVTMSYAELVEIGEEDDPGGAVGYVMLCGPGASPGPIFQKPSALSDFMGGPRFSSEGDGVVSLNWLEYVHHGDNDDRMLVEGVTPNTRYVVDATFNHESVTSCSGTVDISVNGQTVAEGISIVYSPLRSIALYNFGPGVSMIGGIEIWSERAAPNQAWKSDLGDY